ncbi:MAG: GNAT family N-acetyltransferase [Planctomycetes bacterium]|nr:GNAT family N-acetyltransferase [Planctomycetota bacterium]
MTARIERAEPRDDAARLALHEHAFGFRPPPGTFAWKYRENPHGPAIELVVREGEDILAAFALVPRRVRIDGVTVVAHQASDAMTRVEGRSRGWFTKLLEEAHRLAREAGSAFAFAFSGRHSRNAFQRTGYSEVERYAVVERRLRVGLPWRDGATWRMRDLDALDAGQGSAMGPERDPEWLRWRVTGISPSLHAIAEDASGRAVVLERQGTRAVIARHVGRPRDESLRALLRHLRRMGVRRVQRTAFCKEPEEATWRRVGLGFDELRALPFCVKPLRVEQKTIAACLTAESMGWCDLDRDAQGLLLRSAMSGTAT